MALLLLAALSASAKYKSFKVSIYTRAQEVYRMSDNSWLQSTWKTLSDQVKVDKVYLESHRDLIAINESTMNAAKTFFKGKGVETGGGICYTINEANNFETFCYSNSSHRKTIQQLAETAAKYHNDFILDDFFFTSCKADVEIEARGTKSWSDYRRELLAAAGRDLVVKPAHAVNPEAKAIIKYPNWYDHFAGLGFDLAAGPKIFDGIWTGTETRDPSGAQHLQPYLSYNAVRYFENCGPGKNGGGWVDVFGVDNPALGADRYAEQLWLTMFAKAKEINLFAYNWLLDWKLNSAVHRTAWQGKGSSFDYDDCVKPFKNEAGETVTPTTFARIAGWVFEKIDNFVSKLGKPVGIHAYSPPNARGESFIHNFLGMIGLPIEMTPTYPTTAKTVLITAQAAGDADLAKKMDATLRAGGTVVVTSGLVAAAPEKVSRIVEVSASEPILINNFGGATTTKDILVRQIWYNTNDAWEITSAGRPLTGGFFGVPLVLRGLYGGKGGSLYVLAIPQNPSDLYVYPADVLNAFREAASHEVGIRIRGPAKVSLFVYDNGYFIVENFNDAAVDIQVVLSTSANIQEDAATGTYSGRATAGMGVSVHLNPHQFRVFQAK
jgi:hypothetical protein